jgi:hypothetical protein
MDKFWEHSSSFFFFSSYQTTLREAHFQTWAGNPVSHYTEVLLTYWLKGRVINWGNLLTEISTQLCENREALTACFSAALSVLCLQTQPLTTSSCPGLAEIIVSVSLPEESNLLWMLCGSFPLGWVRLCFLQCQCLGAGSLSCIMENSNVVCFSCCIKSC